MSGSARSDVAGAVRALQHANAPSILIGPGARRAIRPVAELARRLGAPVMTTPDAKSTFDETNPHAAGVFSFGATSSTQAIVQASDVVIAIGTNLGEFASQGGRAFDRAALIHVADDPYDLPIGLSVAATVIGDVAITVRTLTRRIGRNATAHRWFESLLMALTPRDSIDGAPRHGIDPREAMRAIGDALPPRARLACDVTSAALHVLHGLRLGPKRRLWIQLEKSACMGSALSAGLGVRLASDVATLVVMGDWGFMMGAQELHTVASLRVAGFVVVVWSNAGGALIRAGVRAQGLSVPNETHSWAPPRFALVAKGYGIRALTVRSSKGLRRAATVAMRAPFPVLIDAIIDPDAEIPGAQARYIHLDTSKRPQ